jgi:hypothetical protein
MSAILSNCIAGTVVHQDQLVILTAEAVADGAQPAMELGNDLMLIVAWRDNGKRQPGMR